ncbi:hypothetical protein DFH07DRAFT_960773 [Mycena maculata]|uniref:RlpA-like protein double-psi beta-barrel domain-containing protein n=1 Tax=Mycena maculata TaxID=230809 RepID=A0AAD7IWH0_9AGAR|nr:hypothetical protein DFH07DRAFT_960773 [Mycena maculata]
MRFHIILLLLSSVFMAAYSAPIRAAQTCSGDGGSAAYLRKVLIENHVPFPGTFYEPGLGACGVTNNAKQLIVAVGHGVFDSYPGADASNPNKNPICGKKLKATYGQKSVIVTVEDRCAGCAGAADLDFTVAGFQQLASPTVGRIQGVKWEWV